MKKLVPLMLLIATTSAYGLCFRGPESIPPGEVIFTELNSDVCKPYPTVRTTKIIDGGFPMCEGFGQTVPEGFYVLDRNRSTTICGCLEKHIWRGSVTCVKYRDSLRIRKR